jgi:Uma2 family endonuclease
MTTTTKRLTLEQYLNYDDGTDTQYELVAGELVVMPPESPQNSIIARYLLAQLLQVVPIQRLCHKDTEIVISGSRATTRLPDLMVLTEELAEVLQSTQRGTILLDMPPPLLVVEVVSPGKQNQDRDYRYKRSEYAARGIAEYWIVDPEKAVVMVLTLVDGLYEEAVFRGTDVMRSTVFPDLHLIIERVLQTSDH